MENFLLAFGVVMPLVVYMAVGMLLSRFRVFSDRFFSELSKLVFYLATPALCFDNLRSIDFSTLFDDPYVISMGIGVTVLFFITFLLVPRFVKQNPRRGPIVMGLFRSNDGIFGLAVAASLFQDEGLALMAVCVSITIPLFNLFAVLEMEAFRGGKVNLLQVLKKVITNPIIIGCILGFLIAVTGFELPAFLAKPISAFGALCAPVGFLALGGMLTFDSLRENRVSISLVTLLRLFVIPFIFIAVFRMFGFPGDVLLIALIIFGAPAAMSVVPMSAGMGGDEKLAAGIVAATSVLSLLSVFLFIFFMKQLGIA